MPRNAAGIYQLPNPPVVPDTTIESGDENVTRSDIAAELTNSLDRNGRGGMLAPFRIADGSAAVPGLAFLNDPNSGIYRESADVWHAVAGGASVVQFSSNGVVVTGTGSQIRFTDGTKSGYLTAGNAASMVALTDGSVGTGNGLLISTSGAPQVNLNIGGTTALQVLGTGVEVRCPTGNYLRVQAGVFTAPAAGAGVEIFSAAGIGWVQAYDRASPAYQALRLSGSQINGFISGASKLQLDATGLTVTNTLTVNGIAVIQGTSLAVGSAANTGNIVLCRTGDGAAAGQIAYVGGEVRVNDSAASNGVCLQYNGVTQARVNANGLNWGAYLPGAYPNVGYIQMRTLDGTLHQIACIA